MKHSICLILLFAAALSNQSFAQISAYRVIDDEGIANVVFANNTISKGMEKHANLKTKFLSDESIYARCYFPAPFEHYDAKAKEDFVVDLYVDGRFVERKKMLHPDADWDQIQMYLLNTGDDDFKRLESYISSLDSGNHSLLITVGLERFMHQKEIIKSDGTIVKEDVFNLQIISKGSITIIVNE
jgi:hypothetical protein